MIILFHVLFGAIVAAKISYLPLAALLALLSHYFLDVLPHDEYSLDNITARKWKKSGIDFLKIFLDVATSFCIILLFYHFYIINYLSFAVIIFFSLFPDILNIFEWLFPKNKLLQKHCFFHHQVIHFLKYKKISYVEKALGHTLAILIGLLIMLS